MKTTTNDSTYDITTTQRHHQLTIREGNRPLTYPPTRMHHEQQYYRRSTYNIRPPTMYSIATRRAAAVREFVHVDSEVVFMTRIGISVVFRSPAISGTGNGSSIRSPLVGFCVGVLSFANRTLCRVGWAWRGRAAAGDGVPSREPFLNGTF